MTQANDGKLIHIVRPTMIGRERFCLYSLVRRAEKWLLRLGFPAVWSHAYNSVSSMRGGNFHVLANRYWSSRLASSQQLGDGTRKPQAIACAKRAASFVDKCMPISHHISSSHALLQRQHQNAVYEYSALARQGRRSGVLY